MAARVTLRARLLEHPTVYRLWQAPFVEAKLAPVARQNDLRGVRRVLDVGCGPGTNTAHFLHTDYVGVDLNPRYLEYARRRFGKEFIAADVAAGLPGFEGQFDFVLVNSFFHHVDDRAAHRILAALRPLVAPGGHVHIIDLVLPEQAGTALTLARLDRGPFARPLEVWRRLFGSYFEPVHVEPYVLSLLGVPLWHKVYFKGRPAA
jgi:SAM-dependent methyltransferase